MSQLFQLAFQGLRSGFGREQVIGWLVPMFKRSEGEIGTMLDTPGLVIKKAIPFGMAKKYLAALEQCGCCCVIEPEAADDAPAAPTLAGQPQRNYTHAGMGIALDAPANWEDKSTADMFTLLDPEAHLRLQVCCEPNRGMSLYRWNDVRLPAIKQAMPFLTRVATPTALDGPDWSGIATVFSGQFPGAADDTRMLIVCVRSDALLLTITVTAPPPVYLANVAFLHTLLCEQLSLRDPPPPAEPAPPPVPADPLLAPEHADLLRRANDNEADAQFALGLMAHLGQGMLQDSRQAEQWWLKAGAQGHQEAQNNLGILYANGMAGAPDPYQAAIWYRRAADQGNMSAQFNLGNMYASGTGVPQDHWMANEWMRKAAIAGLADAQYNLGVSYQDGLGVSKDGRQAAHWYHLAAEQGLRDAQYSLGVLYATGAGVSADMQQASFWWHKALAQGCAYSRVALAGLAESDISVVPPLAADSHMERLIVEQRHQLGKRRAVLNAATFATVRVALPPDLPADYPLREVWRQQMFLHSEGQVVWAALLRADAQLFAPAAGDGVAHLVYSPDPYFDARPQQLRAIAVALNERAPADPAMHHIARLLADETDNRISWRLPASLTERDVRVVRFVVFRQHLPGGVLNATWFPVLTHPSTEAVMLLPSEFWPVEMQLLWKQGKLG